MIDRKEFEVFAKDRGLSVDKLPHGDYRLFSTGEAYAAWQAARAQSGQGAEPIGYIEQDEFDALKDGCFGASIRAEDDGPDCIPLYTHPPARRAGGVEAGAG